MTSVAKDTSGAQNPTLPAPRRQPARLTYRDGQVMVTPADKSIFFMSAEKATEACRRAIRAEEKVAQFESEVVVPFRDWCDARRDRVSACYLAWPESGVLPVYIVGTKEEYDFDLSKDVSDLAVSFTDRGWAVDPHLLSSCSQDELYSMFNADTALQVYGDAQLV